MKTQPDERTRTFHKHKGLAAKKGMKIIKTNSTTDVGCGLF